MDATTLSSDGKRELERLRTRAYGPDADIHADDEALARLIELEDRVLADSHAPASTLDPPRLGTPPAMTAVGAAGMDVAASEGERAVAEGDGSDSPTPPIAASAGRGSWWRVPLAPLVAVAAVLGLGLGLTLPAFAAPHPVASLRPAPLDGAELDFEMYGIRSDSPVRYESFHDLEVWSAMSEDGSTCIVVTNPTSEWMAAGCAPVPLDPVADINFYPGMRDIEGLDLPVGSVVRFLLDDGVMQVWVAESAQEA